MRRLFDPSIARLGVRPDDPAVAGPRPRGSRRPHTDEKVAGVRRLIEQTTLTYGEISGRTGVGRASICRWTRDGGWQRPPFAPRATDLVPRARASAKLKARMLSQRLAALAERYVRELEQSASVNLEKLGEALELMKMAKLAAMPRHRPRVRRRPTQTPFAPPHPEEARSAVSKDETAPCFETPPRKSAVADLRTESCRCRVNPTSVAAPQHEADRASGDRSTRPIMELCAADVDLHRAPRAAVEDFLAHREPPPKEALPHRPRVRRSKRSEHHAWMLEKERK